MKFIVLFFLTVFLLGCRTLKIDEIPNSNTLLWFDEFNYTGLPDSSRWGYEVGHIRNYEKQYYTKERSRNAVVQDGNLVITTIKEAYEGSEYTSASINTLGKMAFAGDFRIEVRAKLPSGKGIWPAIWMLGANKDTVGFPKCGEMDIMEFVGHTPNVIHGTIHWWDSTAAESASNTLSEGGTVRLSHLHSTYHVYGLERRGSRITLFVDGNRYFSFTPPLTAYPDVFVRPFYLLINTAIGGTWGREIDDSALPQKFYIDYVRAYRL